MNLGTEKQSHQRSRIIVRAHKTVAKFRATVVAVVIVEQIQRNAEFVYVLLSEEIVMPKPSDIKSVAIHGIFPWIEQAVLVHHFGEFLRLFRIFGEACLYRTAPCKIQLVNHAFDGALHVWSSHPVKHPLS